MLYFTLANPKTISLSLFKFLFSFTTLKDAIMRATLLGLLTTFHPTLSAKMPALFFPLSAHTMHTTLTPKSVSCLTLEKETAMKWLDLTNQLLKSALTPLQLKQSQLQPSQAYFLNSLNS